VLYCQKVRQADKPPAITVHQQKKDPRNVYQLSNGEEATWGRSHANPMDMGFHGSPTYTTKARSMANEPSRHLSKDEKIGAMDARNDDTARTYGRGFKEGLGQGTPRIAKHVTYGSTIRGRQPGDPVKASGAKRVLQHLDAGTSRRAGRSRKAADIGGAGPRTSHSQASVHLGDKGGRSRARPGAFSAPPPISRIPPTSSGKTHPT